MSNERIISLFVDQKAYLSGHVDVTEKLYEIIPEEKIEGIKYMIPNASEDGIYFTIVVIEKKKKTPARMGFAGG
jgi:hypothetical protein